MIKLNIKDLPMTIELSGEKGEREIYEIRPAGRKFGAMLNIVSRSVKSLIRKK